MKEPTGKLKFAYQTITNMETIIKKQKKENESLEDALSSILSIEEEGHRFDSDGALAEIFNKCRDILNT